MNRKSIRYYLKSKSWHWCLAVVLTLIALFLRFYRISDTLMFLGDQGRDALIVSRIFKQFDLTLIGPVTSVGNMYLGPLYYYFMLPFLWLSYPSPLGPVYAVAFFSSIAVFLTYQIGKKMFSPLTGLFGAFFVTFSASAIELSRFSWNPNLAPLLSILIIYYCWKALTKPKNWMAVALLFSAIIQLHYLTLLTGISAGILWLISIKTTKKKLNIKSFIKYSLISALIILLSFTPLITFDLLHGGINSKAFGGMFTQEKIFTDKKTTTFTDKTIGFLSNSIDRAETILVKLNLGNQPKIQTSVIIFVSLTLIYLLFKKKNKGSTDALTVLITFLLVGIIGTTAYQHSLFTHYIAYLIPLTALCYGLVLRVLVKIFGFWASPLILVVLFGFIYLNYSRWPLKPNYIFHNTQQISQQVYDQLHDDDKYEIVLLSETRDLYGQSYRYFLSTQKNPPVIKEAGQVPNTLVIIDEEKKIEDVARLPIYEIQIFPTRKIDQFISNDHLADIYILRINNNQDSGHE